jgi:tetraacyldisaccharide 4'-kinase
MDAIPLRAALRLRVARALEEGAWEGPGARALSAVWGAAAAASLARPLLWRDGLRVVTVGGATLGGSGKTPLAIACARALAGEGARVALVGHRYRAGVREARVVRADDDVPSVGDEAIVASRSLGDVALVVVGPTRQAALDLAAELADVVVIDGVLQTTPRRASLALLALDGESPWGAGAVPPRGDLRATKRALLAACDGVVMVGQKPSEEGSAWAARVTSRGAFVSGRLIPWSTLAPLRLGLFVALARPARLLVSLARRDIVPSRTFRVPDHGLPGSPRSPALAALASAPGVDLWLATAKCAVHLEAAGIPHAVLEHTVELDAPLLRTLRADSRDPPEIAANIAP